MRNNPFSTNTPENLSAREVVELFVDIFADIPQIDKAGHSFIHGTRGSGKTMMFKYMLPEVQLELAKTRGLDFNIGNLPYYAIHLPVKTDLFQIQQISNLQSGRLVLAGHYMNMKAFQAIIKSLDKSFFIFQIELKRQEDMLSSAYDVFLNLSKEWGIIVAEKTISMSRLDHMLQVINSEIIRVSRFLGLRELGNDDAYNYGITNFRDYTLPFIEQIKKFIPGNIFLMVDDADNLSIEMQEVLNTWVSHRMTDTLSIKVSTQLRYATYRTTFGKLIESPHDFNYVDLTQIYTSDVNNYLSRVEKIIERRLKYYGISSSPYDFFPEDKSQNQQLEKEEVAIRERHALGQGSSSRVADDIYRYKLPNYMTKLQKTKKSNTFSYSGFRTLVNISSGTIRFFLDPAEKMFSQIDSMTEDDLPIQCIPPRLQNTVIRDWSDEFMYTALPALEASGQLEEKDIQGLKQLIKAMGDLFSRRLLDEDSTERRVFSIFTDRIPSDLEKIVQIGVSYGFFQKSSIHSKEKTGRKVELILSRCLAPHFYLDPTGYSARLSVTPEALSLASKNPTKFVRERLKQPEPSNLPESLFSELS